MERLFDKAQQKGVQELEVYSLNKLKEEILFENNSLKTVKTSQNSGVALRASVNGKLGYTTSTNLDNPEKLIENVINVAAYAQDKDFEFAEKKEYPEVKTENADIAQIPTNQLIEDGSKLIQLIQKYDKNILVGVSFSKDSLNVKLKNTKGIDKGYTKDTFGAAVEARILDGTSILGISSGVNNLSGSYDIEAMAESIISRMSMLRTISSFEAGSKTVIFTPKVLLEVLLTLTEGINGLSVEKGVSPLCGKLEQQIFDPRITIYDDATLVGGVSSMPFDDEGVPAQKTLLIGNGILKSYLHNLKTAQKLGMKPTGNGLKLAGLVPERQLAPMPKPNVTNWVFEPGDTSYEDMLANVKDGVIIDSIMGLFMSNLLNGDFSGNIEIGYAVKNGKITGRVKDAVINENIYKLFKNNLVALSDKIYEIGFGEIFGNHRMPYIMVKDVFIASK